MDGKPAIIFKADDSSAGHDIAVATLALHLPSSTLPLQPLRNAIVHVSPAEDNCNDETVDTHAFAHLKPLTTSDNAARNGSCEAVATKEQHLAVCIDDQSEVPQRFQLTRSPTISFGDCGESPCPSLLDPSCDEAEPDDELLSENNSEAKSSGDAQPTPQISPSLPGSNDGHDIDTTPSNFLLPEHFQRQEEPENRRDIEEDNSILVVSMEFLPAQLSYVCFVLTSSNRIPRTIPINLVTSKV